MTYSTVSWIINIHKYVAVKWIINIQKYVAVSWIIVMEECKAISWTIDLKKYVCTLDDDMSPYPSNYVSIIIQYSALPIYLHWK